MLKYLAAFLATAVVFASVDFAWLSNANALVYRPVLDPVLADQPRLLPAVTFYLVYLAGLLVLVIAPAAGSVRQAALRGGLTGAFAYATYDLTNQATLKVWATSITLADIAWGTFVTALACTAGALVWRLVAKRSR